MLGDENQLSKRTYFDGIAAFLAVSRSASMAWVPFSIDPDDFALIQIYISGNKAEIFLAFVAIANINYFGRNDVPILHYINHNRKQIF